jgi:3-deoxy-manno-octulosonate cytidylyltransferase (CMP-KDO synthetase)
MNILCVIPSRIASTRLARKPLLEIQGKPMIQWVYENAIRCKAITKVVVATDSLEIFELINSIGGAAIMTDPSLVTGSDRVAVVAEQFPEMEVVINLQGDEPFITPTMLESLLAPYLAGDRPEMSTLAFALNKEDPEVEFNDPGCVKVITDLKSNALYFSRAPIPYFRQAALVQAPVYHHMGLYAFRRDFLMQYRSLPQSPLELIESLEQLRALEHGYRIRVCITEERSLEINTLEDYERAQDFSYIG